MDWLQKHWRGAAFTLAGVVGTAIVGKIVDHYFDVSILATLWGVLTSWLSYTMPVPVWLLIPSAVIIALASLKLFATALPDKTTDTSPKLNPDQRRVLQEIVNHIEHQNFPHFRDLKEGTGFSHLVTEGAIDVLIEQGLIYWRYDAWNVLRAELTPQGRGYLLSPEGSSEDWNQGNHP